VKHLRHALNLFEAAGHERGQLVVLINLGIATQHDVGNPLHYYENALTIAQRLGDTTKEAITLNAMAMCHFESHRYLQAERAAVEALHLNPDRNDPGNVHILDTLGQILTAQERHEEAVERFRRALAVHESRGARWYAATVLTHLGHPLRELGRIDEARQVWERALAITDEVNPANRGELQRETLVMLLSTVRARR
jgi:tetratricopeptide (TPR) repeat protein